MMEETAPARRRVVLTGISSRAWEHPADRGALTALRGLAGVDEELRYLLGHELGHLLSGHAVYRTMMSILTGLASTLPLGPIVFRVILFGLLEWWRKAELSADRAGLLAGQDPAAALRAHMKLAGGNDLREIDTAAFLEQAAEYDRGGDLRDSLIQLRMLFRLTHPLPVARAADLRRWIDDGAYARILSGDYPRRENDRDASLTAEVKEAAEEYRRSFARSEDPLAGLLRRFGDGAAGGGGWGAAGAGRMRDWWTGGGRPAYAGDPGEPPRRPPPPAWPGAVAPRGPPRP